MKEAKLNEGHVKLRRVSMLGSAAVGCVCSQGVRGGPAPSRPLGTVLAELGCRTLAHRSGCPGPELGFSGAIAATPRCCSAMFAERSEDLPALGGMPSLHGATSLWLAGFRTFCPGVRWWRALHSAWLFQNLSLFFHSSVLLRSQTAL